MENPVTPPDDIDINQIITEYVGLRDELREAKRNFNEYEREIEGRMEILEVILMEQSDRLGVKSFSTDGGTAYRSKKRIVRVGNWSDLLHNYIIPNQSWHILEKRIGKVATLDIIDETGVIPTGVEYKEEFVMNVLRPNGK